MSDSPSDDLREELDVTRRLAVLADLGEGWLDGDGAALPRETLEWVGEVLASAEAEGLQRPYLYPTPDGMVQAEWSFVGAEVSALFDVAGHRASCVGVHTKTGAHREQDVDLRGADGIQRLVELVSSFHP